MIGSPLVSNMMGGYGISIISSIVYLGNVNIERNEGYGPGGGIFISSSSVVSGNYLSVTNNKATNGGGIYCYMSGLNVTHLVAENNEALRFGGGIFTSSCQTSMYLSLISTNLAGNSGGGMWCYMGWLNATVVRFVYNHAEINGGGYSSNQATTWCQDTFWCENRVRIGNGGGLHTMDSTLMMTNTTLMNNSALVGGGGGVYTSGCSLMFWGSYVAHHVASEGGGIYSYDSTVIFWNSTFLDNTAKIYGGAAYTLTTTLVIYNTSVVNNHISSPGEGGGAGFYLDGSTLVCTNVTFNSNVHHGNKKQDLMCVNSSPNIYQGNALFFSIPIVRCSYNCDVLLVDKNDNQTHLCGSLSDVVERTKIQCSGAVGGCGCGCFRARRKS
eukprot:TRINITY_DN6695_c0_g1_i13.p1 TRINITY_DN6695_c0_g1~~TRINITY_DN6695_c0_g1_i13.p1  ORF type:complete len:384 (-),score=79.26 TRINITY_DN6695_c0_g1_i13:70-1221(-)